MNRLQRLACLALWVALPGCPTAVEPPQTAGNAVASPPPAEAPAAASPAPLAPDSPRPSDCASRFAYLDRNHDGTLSLVEYLWLVVEPLPPPDLAGDDAENTFTRLDTDHDAKLTLAEFSQGCAAGVSPAPSAVPGAAATEAPAKMPDPAPTATESQATPTATPTPAPSATAALNSAKVDLHPSSKPTGTSATIGPAATVASSGPARETL